jgi:hypothetical protein
MQRFQYSECDNMGLQQFVYQTYVLAQDGSATNPSIAFSSDYRDGFYHSAGNINVSIAGVIRSQFVSNGFRTNYLYCLSTATSLQLSGTVADGGAAIANKIGNTASLTTAGAKICSFYNDAFSTEKLSIGYNGAINFPAAGIVNAATTCAISSAGNYIALQGKPTNGATAVATYLQSITNLSTAGAKIVSIANNGSDEKAYFDKDGILFTEVNKRTACGGGSTGATVIPNGTVTLEINGTSYFLLTANSA